MEISITSQERIIPLVDELPTARPRSTTDHAAAAAAAQDFEALYFSEMLRPIFSTVSTNTSFGGGYGEEIYRTLLVDAYAKEIAKTHSWGLSEAVQRFILQSSDVNVMGQMSDVPVSHAIAIYTNQSRLR